MEAVEAVRLLRETASSNLVPSTDESAANQYLSKFGSHRDQIGGFATDAPSRRCRAEGRLFRTSRVYCGCRMPSCHLRGMPAL